MRTSRAGPSARDAPHALHMPSHIFTRVGEWTESAATNRRSSTVAQKNNEPDEALHALDYMTYALLQMARDGDARKALDEAQQIKGITPRFVAPYALTAMPARYALERGDSRARSARHGAVMPRPRRRTPTESRRSARS